MALLDLIQVCSQISKLAPYTNSGKKKLFYDLPRCSHEIIIASMFFFSDSFSLSCTLHFVITAQ